MKLTPKEVEDLVANVVGRDSLNVLRLIKNKKNVSEFKIAENMKLNVNQIRNVLYRMNEHNLVTFTRKKDKKKGWYIYYWTFDEKQAKNLYVFLKRKRLDELKILIDNGKKEESFYVCKTDFIKFDLDEALENNFICPECGKVLIEEKVFIDIDKLKKEANLIGIDISIKTKENVQQKAPEKHNKKKDKKKLNKFKKAR